MARNTNGKGFSLKDHLFNQDKINYLGELLAKVDPQFDAEAFTKKVMSKLKTLELKERIVWMSCVMEEQLPADFEESARIIQKALPPPLDPTKTDNDFGTFIFAPLGEYVVRNGLSKKYLKTSLLTLKEITQRFSMEDAIRYFLNEFEDETLQELALWTSDRHYHVRRLASEGTRPLLPWSGRIKMEVTLAIPFLDRLYYDPTRYVTRSVANHMNDISKKHPKLVVATLIRWKKEGRQEPKEMDWIISHSLITLVKKGDGPALELLGYSSKPNVIISNVNITNKQLKVGETLEFSFKLKAKESGRLMVDYEIDFQKANGKTASKVYKLKKLTAGKGEVYTINKKHHLPENASTITFYPGKHKVTLQINGQKYGSESFELIKIK